MSIKICLSSLVYLKDSVKKKTGSGAEDAAGPSSLQGGLTEAQPERLSRLADQRSCDLWFNGPAVVLNVCVLCESCHAL